MSRLLALLSWLLLALALVAPVAFWIAARVPPGAELRWTLIDFLPKSREDPSDALYGWGGTLHFANSGNIAIEEVRLELSYRPSDLEVFGPEGIEWELLPAEDGRAPLVFGPLPGGEWTDVRLWGLSDPYHVSADGAEVYETRMLPPRFREEPWLSNRWTLALALLATGLLLRTLHLQHRLRA